MKESYFAECLEKFHELPDQLQELIGGFDTCLKIKKIEDAYNVSLGFAAILVAVGELTIDDLPEYLRLKFDLDETKSEEIAGHLEEEIFIPALQFIGEHIAPESDAASLSPFGPISSMSDADKKELILKTFESEIIPALSAEPAKLQDFNVAIFQAFNTDDVLEDKVESFLYNNQEKISEHRLVMDGHPASPSIANWLKDFIKKYGSDIFNEVSLAEYLSSAPNISVITLAEKELVRKVLKLYRNLVFFPDSMNGVPVEQWEIFPVDRTKLNIVRDVLSDNQPLSPVVPVKENPAPTPAPTPVPAPASVPTPAPVPVSENNPEPEMTERQKIIFDLQKNLTKYSTSSLEYKAIHQEINRLSHK